MPKETIVIIDDEPLICEMLQGELKQQGYDVLVAGDGVAAQELFKDLRSRSLFIVDLLMPRLDGWALLDRIREHGAKNKVQHEIIIISGSANAEGIARQEEVGFVAKPFGLKQIVERIEAAFKAR